MSLKVDDKEGIIDRAKSSQGRVLMPDGKGSRMRWRDYPEIKGRSLVLGKTKSE